MKSLLFLLQVLFMTGCTTHYLVSSHAKEDVSRVQYRTIFIQDVDQPSAIDPQAISSIKAHIEFKIRDLGFAMTSRPEQADALMEISVLRYRSYLKWDPGTPGTYTAGYYNKKGRWVPGRYVEGKPAGYYESGEVEIRLKLLDANTHQLLWDSLAAGTGVPSGIIANVLADLLGCMQVSLGGKGCQEFMQS
jgi:hypothetical protein